MSGPLTLPPLLPAAAASSSSSPSSIHPTFSPRASPPPLCRVPLPLWATARGLTCILVGEASASANFITSLTQQADDGHVTKR